MLKGQGCSSDLDTLRMSILEVRRWRDTYQESRIHRLQLRSWWGDRRGFCSQVRSFEIGSRIEISLMDIVELGFAISKVYGGCEVPAKV
jgi:hypothetical protein